MLNPKLFELAEHAAPTIAALAAFISALASAKKVQELKVSVDGRLDELIREAKASAHAAGRRQAIEERAAEDESAAAEELLPSPGSLLPPPAPPPQQVKKNKR